MKDRILRFVCLGKRDSSKISTSTETNSTNRINARAGRQNLMGNSATNISSTQTMKRSSDMTSHANAAELSCNNKITLCNGCISVICQTATPAELKTSNYWNLLLISCISEALQSSLDQLVKSSLCKSFLKNNESASALAQGTALSHFSS